MSFTSGTATNSRGFGRAGGEPAGGAAGTPEPAGDGDAGVSPAPGCAVAVEGASAGGPPGDGVVVALAVGAGSTAVARRFAQPSATRGTATRARTMMGATGNRGIDSAPFGGHLPCCGECVMGRGEAVRRRAASSPVGYRSVSPPIASRPLRPRQAPSPPMEWTRSPRLRLVAYSTTSALPLPRHQWQTIRAKRPGSNGT